MSNSLKYHDAWKSYRAAVRAARDRYERELARLEPYKDSKRGAEQMEEARATFEGELEAARASARPAFSAALKAMREHVGKPSMTPPSAEQLATLQALELRTDLENGEIEAAAEIMRGNDLAMRTLRDVAKRKGRVVPAGMATIAEQATEAVEKLARASENLMAWDGRTAEDVRSDYQAARHAYQYAGGSAPREGMASSSSVADLEATTYKETVKNAINSTGYLHIGAGGVQDVIPHGGATTALVDALG